MMHFELRRLVAEQAGQPWLEFLRAPSLSMGVYHLKAGQEDPQKPHTEDEVYYVVAGRARFRSGREERDVGPGTLLFVERLAEHRFFAVAEDLTTLVLFAPPKAPYEKERQQVRDRRAATSGPSLSYRPSRRRPPPCARGTG